MSRHLIPVSLLYSTTGPYGALGREAVDGALAAIAETNADPTLSFQIEPVIEDPAGSAERYAMFAETAVRQKGCRHIVGSITSSSRKEILPVVERHGALLWYAFPYEGYEASDSVIYLGACPNQHLLPLFDTVMPRFGRRPFIVGSNYIWGWEISRIAREIIEASGGQVVSERFVPLGSTDIDHLIEEIRQKKPDFILSNLVGESIMAFLQAYEGLRKADSVFSANSTPIIACNLCETDLAGLCAEARAGHMTTSIYFDGISTDENAAFKARMAKRYGGTRCLTTPFVSAYTAMSVLARAITDAGTDAPEAIRRTATARVFDTPIGALRIDPRTHHAALRPHIAVSDEAGRYQVFQTAPKPIEADPYLVRSSHRDMSSSPVTTLKVIK
ncbi:branched-chain amino acid transport system substrate-binding protein [Agrobacterium vitis]|nr:branched-chain amino acid transport system substrate-binding protein [Agrobacterium vitis]MBE1436487.1 branched-chain amino acid transport system substrate-binding protein [Agrobacterium vitis]